MDYENGDPKTFTSVLVGPDDLETVVDHGSLIQVTGTNEAGTERITFAGDHRPMAGFLAAVQAEGDVLVAAVADYQIQGVEIELDEVEL
jgi:hypothetical protein